MAQVNRATGTFELASTSQPYDEGEGARLFRSSYSKTFRGDIEATSSVEVLRAMAETVGSGGYVGIERVTGAVQGRSGSFVLQHSGTMARGQLSHAVTVVPDTGTGQLRGIRGEMTITVADGKHEYSFDYALDA